LANGKNKYLGLVGVKKSVKGNFWPNKKFNQLQLIGNLTQQKTAIKSKRQKEALRMKKVNTETSKAIFFLHKNPKYIKTVGILENKVENGFGSEKTQPHKNGFEIQPLYSMFLLR